MQAGFCSPRVMDILARELNLPLTAIRKNEKGSEIVFGKTKMRFIMENKITKSLVIIGGGPAGLAAAVAAAENGLPAEDILILERDGRLGGILNQCIHNGFGLHTFKEELTGPEYAARFEERAKALHIPYKLGAMVLSISPEKVVTAVSREDGLFTVEAGAVILPWGCRERSRRRAEYPRFPPRRCVLRLATAPAPCQCEGYMPDARSSFSVPATSVSSWRAA